jgi:ATP-dependent DNA helicase RecQ
MLALCETVDCRRVQLLRYFGQDYLGADGAPACGNCDTCLAPPETWDGTIAAQKLLSTIVRLDRERGQKFGAGHLIDILHGKNTDRVLQQRHDGLTTFGIGTDLTEQEWRGVVRQLLARGLLAVQGEYGILAITPASAGVLSGATPVMLRREVARKPKTTKRSAGPELPAESQDLFERLRAWRAVQAREQGVPAYIVFGDATLRGVAAVRPGTLAELAEISGVGEKKLEAYGAAVLAIVGGGAAADAAPPSPVTSFAPPAELAPRPSRAADPDPFPFDDEPPVDEWGPE